jgi:hypothetical protein
VQSLKDLQKPLDDRKSLLMELLKQPVLEKSTLAGGTALAVIYGHHKSVDLDLFGSDPLDKAEIRSGLSSALEPDTYMAIHILNKPAEHQIFFASQNLRTALTQ